MKITTDKTERYITVTGWAKGHKQAELNPDLDHTFSDSDYETGYVVYRYNTDGTKTYLDDIDPDETITLSRCAEILRKAEKLTGNTYIAIDITDVTFDLTGKTLRNKKYTYNKAKKLLRIWENHMPVYENWDGQICKDRDALADCLL